MAEVLGLPIGDVFFINYIYDLTAFCTGIIAQKADGQIIHGRNLDYNFAEYLQNLTYIAQFQRNNSLLFTSAQVAGYLGVLTGHKHNAFTFEINERGECKISINVNFQFFYKRFIRVR